MAKKLNRIFAMVMVLFLFAGMLPLQALAAESTETTTETSPEGLTTNVTTTTTTTTDENGNTTVTVTIDKATSGTTEDGVTVNREESSSTTTTTNADGDVTEQTVTEGSEIKEWDEDVQPGQDVPEVKVELIPGQSSSKTETGDVPTDENDNEYDYTKTEIERTVEVSTEDVTVTVEKDETDLEAVAPENYEGKNFDSKEGLIPGLTENAFGLNPENAPQPEEDGYDFQWTGYSDATNAVRAVSVEVVYRKDPTTGEPMKDESGNFIIESTTYAGNYEDGMDSTPAIFVLTKYDEEGNPESFYYAYCIDNDTPAEPGSWYTISNLEDSDYYPDDESAAKLRAIVTNGYWGKESGNGSMAQMKEMIEAYYDDDATVTIDDKNGNPVTFEVSDVIDRMTEADALAVTQAAIWSYANGALNVQDGEDGKIIEAIYSVWKPKSNLANTDRDYDYERDALLKAAYQWILSLEGISQEDDSVSTIINEDNAIKDMYLTVKDKAENFEENEDTNKDNDVYNTELNFTLAFVPDPESDDLLVYLTDAEGNKLKDANGEDIVRRLAGKNSEGRTAETIYADENGVYTLTGLQLAENSDFTFDLRLEGTQNLKEGVYVYKAYGGVSESQTMVGMASGKREVEVAVGMTISFDVDENNHVVAERSWYNESNTNNAPPADPDEEDGPQVYRLGKDDGTVEIPDEEVPLANAPTTGDESGLWVAVIMMAAVALYVVNVISKKHQNEAF